MYEYRADCRRVVDGDTIDLDVDMGFYMKAGLRFRVLYIDTPELRRGDDAHKARGRAASARVVAIMEEARDFLGDFPLVIRTEKADSFGRWLAEIMVPESIPSIAGVRCPFLDNKDPDGDYIDPTAMISLADVLLREKHAVPYKK